MRHEGWPKMIFMPRILTFASPPRKCQVLPFALVSRRGNGYGAARAFDFVQAWPSISPQRHDRRGAGPTGVIRG